MGKALDVPAGGGCGKSGVRSDDIVDWLLPDTESSDMLDKLSLAVD